VQLICAKGAALSQLPCSWNAEFLLHLFAMYECVCVCACVCVCVCVRERERENVCVCMCNQCAKEAVCSPVALLLECRVWNA